jgi:Tfp pilus assembly protein PilO
MFRLLIPIILIATAITGFVVYANPIFVEITKIKTEIVSYNEALDNSKALENERDKLTKKFNTLDPNDLEKLQKLLPDNVDNIRLILEIEKLASPYQMILRNVKYNSTLASKKKTSLNTGTETQTPTEPTVGLSGPESSKEYGEWTLGFTTEGTYSDFVNFVKDIENNLRIVDISSVTFSSDSEDKLKDKKKPIDSYTYDFKIKTYWLKN